MNPKNNIDRLVEAMKHAEGWHPAGDPMHPLGSRSYRNHNPLNLRESPFAFAHIDGFAVFENDETGKLAAQVDILQKALGHTTTELNGNSTLRQLLEVWAPPGDNNKTPEYVDNILTSSGFSGSITLASLLSA